MNPSGGKADAVALDLDVLIEMQAWGEALPGVEDLCRTAASAAYVHACAQPGAQHGARQGVQADGRRETGPRRAPRSPIRACLLLADDARMRALNHTFRGRDEPTDVLSFPGVGADVLAAVGADGPPPELGDIVIAFETTAADAALEGKSLKDHLRHLVIHGILHLLGYDHQTEADAAEMEALEVRTLAALSVADPYTQVGELRDE